MWYVNERFNTIEEISPRRFLELSKDDEDLCRCFWTRVEALERLKEVNEWHLNQAKQNLDYHQKRRDKNDER